MSPHCRCSCSCRLIVRRRNSSCPGGTAECLSNDLTEDVSVTKHCQTLLFRPFQQLELLVKNITRVEAIVDGLPTLRKLCIAIFIQLVLEFMTLALAAGALGMFLARAVAGGVATLPLPILFDVSLDVRTVLFTGAIAVASGLLCALVPALALSGTDPRTAAAPATAMQPRRQRWPSRALVVSQVTLSVILLFTTGLGVRTFANLTAADPGFDPGNLLTAQFDPSLQGYSAPRIADFYQRLTEAATAIPGVEAVAMADALPAAGNFGTDGWFFENATEPEQSSSVSFSAVSANFFSTMGIPIVDGRGFRDNLI